VRASIYDLLIYLLSAGRGHPVGPHRVLVNCLNGGSNTSLSTNDVLRPAPLGPGLWRGVHRSARFALSA